MRIYLSLEIEASDDRCEEILEEVEAAHVECEGITVKTAGGQFSAEIMQWQEVPA